jgi:hypothetical protein
MAAEAIAAAWAAISDTVVTAAGSEAVQAGVASAVAGGVVSSVMQPKIPGVKAPAAMPDQNAIDAARRRSALDQMARRGRASTILSDPRGHPWLASSSATSSRRMRAPTPSRLRSSSACGTRTTRSPFEPTAGGTFTHATTSTTRVIRDAQLDALHRERYRNDERRRRDLLQPTRDRGRDQSNAAEPHRLHPRSERDDLVNAKELHQQGEQLYGKRTQLMLLWQEMALNFYPERADFTYKRVVGQEFAINLTTSYPLLARRDLGNAFGTMLRPTAKPWFHPRPAHEGAKIDIERAAGLSTSRTCSAAPCTTARRNFTRATKEGDHDFAAFGQCVISVELNRNADALLYRCWHLRDVAWAENEEGKVGQVYRKWKPTARNLMRLFPGKVDKKVEQAAGKDPFREFDCRHMVVESDMYDGKFKTPYVSIYYDVENDNRDGGTRHLQRVLRDPAVADGLRLAVRLLAGDRCRTPDARLIQASPARSSRRARNSPIPR